MCLSRPNRIFISIIFCAIFVLGLSPASATNRMSIDVAKSGVAYDTLYVGGEYELRTWIENEFILGGIQITYKVWSDDGVTWKYVARPDGIGQNHACITVVPESRLGPDGSALDMTHLLVSEFDFDMQGYDHVGFGGVAMMVGVPIGPLEHMVSWHISPTGLAVPGTIGTFCIDTGFVPPSAAQNVFIGMDGHAMRPDYDCTHCWPVKLICGNPNGDNDVNVGDAVFMINYVFREGPPPDPWWLGDANCDGTLNVGDVVFLIAAAFRYGPQPECCE
jgi:hypothetical protein